MPPPSAHSPGPCCPSLSLSLSCSPDPGPGPGPGSMLTAAQGSAAGAGSPPPPPSQGLAEGGVTAWSGGSCWRLQWHEELLLASALAQHLGPLLNQAYSVQSVLLPQLLALHRARPPHQGTACRKALALMAACLDAQAFRRCCQQLLEGLVQQCAIAPLRPEDIPYSGSYPYLALICCLLGSRWVRGCWLCHPELQGLLERALTRKPPSHDDLQTLLPCVWWPGCSKPGSSQAGMEAAVAGFAAALAKVEEQQARLLGLLAGRVAQGLDPGGREDALLTFLRGLLLKNRDALRDVPPPGLSDPTLLIAVFFALLRLLRPVLPAMNTFPAGDLFVKNTWRGESDLVNDLPRLGGGGQLGAALPAGAPWGAAAAAGRQLGGLALQRRLKPAAWPELLNSALLLYGWRVGQSLRSLQNADSSLATNLANLAEGEGALLHLEEAHGLLMEDLDSNVRYSRLVQVVFFNGAKLQALVQLAEWLARLLMAARQVGGLLGYLPTVYLEVVVDVVQALCKPSHAAATMAYPTSEQLEGGWQGGGEGRGARKGGGGEEGPPAALRQLEVVSEALVCVLADPRIANPDLKEQLLGSIATMLEN
ncbi:hypothetical protein V8C86DRAFT_3032013, partial [Haematococcus lacustris]